MSDNDWNDWVAGDFLVTTECPAECLGVDKSSVANECRHVSLFASTVIFDCLLLMMRYKTRKYIELLDEW